MIFEYCDRRYTGSRAEIQLKLKNDLDNVNSVWDKN